MPRAFIQQFKLQPAQKIRGTLRPPRDREKMIMLDEVLEIEGIPAAEWTAPTPFDNLTPLYPEGRIMLENSKTNSISARAVDLLTPLGRGQRGLIVAAPRVGKTILLKEIAKAIRVNHKEISEIPSWWTSGRKGDGPQRSRCDVTIRLRRNSKRAT